MLLIDGIMGFIKNGTYKHINKLSVGFSVSIKYTKVNIAELLIALGEYFRCKWKITSFVEYTNSISAEGLYSPNDGSCICDGKAPVMQELWGRESTPTLQLFSGSFWPDGVLTVGLIELFDI